MLMSITVSYYQNMDSRNDQLLEHGLTDELLGCQLGKIMKSEL